MSRKGRGRPRISDEIRKSYRVMVRLDKQRHDKLMKLDGDTKSEKINILIDKA